MLCMAHAGHISSGFVAFLLLHVLTVSTKPIAPTQTDLRSMNLCGYLAAPAGHRRRHHARPVFPGQRCWLATGIRSHIRPSQKTEQTYRPELWFEPRILELDQGKGIPFQGNYSGWLEHKAAAFEFLW